MDADVGGVGRHRERQTYELKADFVASVSHELRTLTPIKGFLMTLLREDRDFAQDRRREYYKLMLMQSQRLERLIEDLLEVTRLEAGAGLVDATAIDAVDLVRQVADIASPARPRPHGACVALDHAVYCRGDWMGRPGAGRVSTPCAMPCRTSRWRSASSPRAARLCSRSATGARGISSTSSRASLRFHRVGHYMTREPGGAGLGLYLAKRLVEAMGGRIWVSSRLGHGSVFSFALPAEPSFNAVAPATATPANGRRVGILLPLPCRPSAGTRTQGYAGAATAIIMGAAGRDFHNFNSVFRGDLATTAVAFTATQIPYIDDRTYPATPPAGLAYPRGILIVPEERLEDLITGDVDEVFCAT